MHGTAVRSRRRQVVYVSNHSSTLDLFVLVALGLPNTRFFLSGFLQKFVPLGILARLMGTFFTVPQDRPDERRRIFARACAHARAHRRVRVSEPRRRTDHDGRDRALQQGRLSPRHGLGAPIVPLYFFIPRESIRAWASSAARTVVDVFVKPAIDTHGWRVEDVGANKERVRDLFVEWHREARHDAP